MERNCLTKFINTKVNTIIDNQSNIKMGKLDDAFGKVSKIKDEANQAIAGMLENMNEADKLAETSKDLQF